jgi:hypothetical protein
LAAGLDVDGEYALEPLRPGHPLCFLFLNYVAYKEIVFRAIVCV